MSNSKPAPWWRTAPQLSPHNMLWCVIAIPGSVSQHYPGMLLQLYAPWHVLDVTTAVFFCKCRLYKTPMLLASAVVGPLLSPKCKLTCRAGWLLVNASTDAGLLPMWQCNQTEPVATQIAVCWQRKAVLFERRLQPGLTLFYVEPRYSNSLGNNASAASICRLQVNVQQGTFCNFLGLFFVSHVQLDFSFMHVFTEVLGGSLLCTMLSWW